MELLLLADPSEQKIRAYLSRSRCFVALNNGAVAGTCVVQPGHAGAYEIMSIAVRPDSQKMGIGTALLKWVVECFRQAGATQLDVGTGTFGYQLAFYQRQGFRVQRVDRDFFLRNYARPIMEEGIQLLDMLRLSLRYEENGSVNPADQETRSE